MLPLRTMQFYCVIFVLLIVSILPPSLSAAELSAMKVLEQQGYEVAGLVVDLESGRRVAELNPDKLMTPASVTKLYTAAHAIEVWGPDYRFETDLLVRGEQIGDVVNGDLIFKGGGDPVLTNEGLWRLALDVAQSGIREFSGDLIVDESRFGQITCITHDRCDAEKSSWHTYDALLSSASVNHGNLAVVVTPSPAIGGAATVRLDPHPLASIEIDGSIQTVKGYGANFGVSRFSDAVSDSLKVNGTIGAGAGKQRIYRSVGRPARYTGELFRAFLKEAGVAVSGDVRVSTEKQEGRRLTTYQGRPLSEAVADMLYYSNNSIADLLTLNLLVEKRPDVPVSLPIAASVLQNFAQEMRAKAEFGSGARGRAQLYDGSGLNPDNKLTPADLVAVLAGVYQRTQDFPFLLGAMRVPAQSPLRGLSGGDELLDRISTKTGGLSEPVSVHTLAGYLRFKDGGWGAFALLANGTSRNRIYRVKAFEAMRKDLQGLKATVYTCN